MPKKEKLEEDEELEEGEKESSKITSKSAVKANAEKAEKPPKVLKTKEDYLKPYEYHKPSGRSYFQVPEVTYVPPQKDSDAAKTKAELLLQPKIRMMIPRPFKEDPSILQSVGLNGYRLDYPKNTYIDVPEEIANIIRESLQQSEAALNHPSKIAGDERKEMALG